MKKKAVWNDEVIAESDNLVNMEGNYYFPVSSLKSEYLKDSSTHTHCPWKGAASYYSIEINGKSNKDAAWYYPDPKPAAAKIKDRVAFWRGVEIVDA
jgi:uncharacterized protein (DUF427 family)